MAEFLKSTMEGLNKAQDLFNQNVPLSADQRAQFRSNGFLIPATFSADGNGLPYTKVTGSKQGRSFRNIISWFIPEFGVVRMYINPHNITYNYSKLINADRTKGGFTLQYWGENLIDITLTGTTGSSGIEGINMLYEMYRAEQYAFDAVGLTLAASNASTDLASKAVDFLGSSIGSTIGGKSGGAIGSSLLSGVLGIDSPNNNALASKNIMSLAQLAFTVEMYYNGWVFRGYFKDMLITESADNFLLNYTIKFVATQKRGYRVNYFPFHKSANNGPSQYNSENSFASSQEQAKFIAEFRGRSSEHMLQK